jgi:hypothetical protein
VPGDRSRNSRKGPSGETSCLASRGIAKKISSDDIVSISNTRRFTGGVYRINRDQREQIFNQGSRTQRCVRQPNAVRGAIRPSILTARYRQSKSLAILLEHDGIDTLYGVRAAHVYDFP